MDSREEEKSRAVLVVVAHPDDESMFFWPTLCELMCRGRNVTLLCVGDTTEERRAELEKSASLLGIARLRWGPAKQFPDSMAVRWDVGALVRLLEQELALQDFKSVLTFDSAGVSGHPNHIQCSEGCRVLWEKRKSFHLLELCSVPLWRKYLSVWDSLASTVLSAGGREDQVSFIARDWFSWAKLWNHMAICYPSQFVWYRKLYVVFTRYAYQNDYLVHAAKTEKTKNKAQ